MATGEGESKETRRMKDKKENQFIDADRFLDVYESKIEDYKPSQEVLEEFAEAAKQTSVSMSISMASMTSGSTRAVTVRPVAASRLVC